MHIELDKHWEKNSFIHRLEDRLRIVSVLFWGSALVLIETLWLEAVGLFFCCGLVFLMRIPCKDVAVRIGYALLVLLPLLFLLPVLAPEEAMGDEFVAACTILCRAGALMLLTFPLFNAARFHKTLSALKALGVPAVFMTIFLLSYRAVFVLHDDARRMRLSAQTRAWSGKGYRRVAAFYVSQVGSLLVKSLARTERIWKAMQNRGYSGRFPVLDDSAVCAGDWLVFLGLSLVPAGLMFGEFLW